MTKLIITEKKHVANELMAALKLPQNTFDIIYSSTFQKHKLKLPKISFNQIPYSVFPKHTSVINNPEQFNIATGLLMTIDGETTSTIKLNNEELTGRMTSQFQNVREKLKAGEYKEVICVIDPDPIGHHCANLTLEALQVTQNVYLSMMKPTSLEHKGLADMFDNRTPLDKQHDELVLGQRNKLVFDYLWNTNSALVLGEAMKFSGLRPVHLSKYQLIALLYAHKTHGTELFSAHSLNTAMQRWKGSGKYQNDNVRLGSPRSAIEIFTGLIRFGAFTPLDVYHEHYRLNKQWLPLFDLIHPRTMDIDLPFRVEQWRQTDSEHEITRYINTMFGRQLRYQRKKIKAQS